MTIIYNQCGSSILFNVMGQRLDDDTSSRTHFHMISRFFALNIEFKSWMNYCEIYDMCRCKHLKLHSPRQVHNVILLYKINSCPFYMFKCRFPHKMLEIIFLRTLKIWNGRTSVSWEKTPSSPYYATESYYGKPISKTQHNQFVFSVSWIPKSGMLWNLDVFGTWAFFKLFFVLAETCWHGAMHAGARPSWKPDNFNMWTLFIFCSLSGKSLQLQCDCERSTA